MYLGPPSLLFSVYNGCVYVFCFLNLEVGRIIPIDKRESRKGGERGRNLWRAGLLFFLICLIGNGGWGETGRVLCDRSVYFVLPRSTGLLSR